VRPEHFVVAGAQRSGTSFLARLLDLHPQIDVARPLRPEPKFFLRPEAAAAGRAEYEALFPPAGPQVRLRGEKSTSYLERSEAAERIHRLLPAARLVFVLRDPVERALSNYRFSVDHGVETAGMEVAFREEEARREDYPRDRFSVSPFAYLRRGDYADLLRPFAERFPREQLILVLFDDLVRDAAGTLARLLVRLGADPDRQPPVSGVPLNESRDGAEASPELRRFLVDRFAAGNRRLAEQWNLDLAGWQGCGAPALAVERTT
jgi:hypothetical protein